MIIGLDHVQITMPPGREQDARRFYGEILHLKEIEKPAELKASCGVWFVLPDGRHFHIGVEAEFRPNRKAHPCFVATNYDELVECLTAHGYEVLPDARRPPVRRFFTNDIFGNRLEFADRMTEPTQTP